MADLIVRYCGLRLAVAWGLESIMVLGEPHWLDDSKNFPSLIEMVDDLRGPSQGELFTVPVRYRTLHWLTFLNGRQIRPAGALLGISFVRGLKFDVGLLRSTQSVLSLPDATCFYLLGFSEPHGRPVWL